MKKTASLLLGFIVLILALSPTVQAEEHTVATPGITATSANAPTPDLDGVEFAEDRVIVKLASVNPRARNAAVDLGVEYTEMRQLNPPSDSGISLYSSTAEGKTYVLILEQTGRDAVINTLEILNGNPAVEYAEPSYYRELYAVPNDPQYAGQYALQKINAEAAWELTYGDENIVVGVIDTGIEGSHSDLADNLWAHGKDFSSYKGYEEGPPTDEQGHGTQVAGIIGAVGNNGEGISGINWDVSLAWLGAYAGSNKIEDAAAIEAIYYAQAMGIPVINCSWGGDEYSKAMEDAIKSYSGLLVAAAGNGDSTGKGYDIDLDPVYPACYELDNIITVAATDSNDDKPRFSNYGENSVDIAAPGYSVTSTKKGNIYGATSGTSFAAPYVAGVASLIKANTPDCDAQTIRETIIKSARTVPALQNEYGFGVLDAFAALTSVKYIGVTSITLNKSSTVLLTGKTETLSATVFPPDATNRDVTWSSSNTAVATVYGSAVTAISPGIATITAITSDGNKKAVCAVTVMQPHYEPPPVVIPSPPPVIVTPPVTAPPPEEIIAPSSKNASINVTEETIDLPDNYNVVAYSVNGGRTWKRGKLPADTKKVSAMFNKKMSLVVAKELGPNRKPIPDIVFQPIAARPKANIEKLGLYYDDDSWELRIKKGFGEPVRDYEYALADKKGRQLDDWQDYTEAFDISQRGSSKTYYLFRTKAQASGGTYTPAGKQFKITPATYSVAPKLKIDTRRMRIKIGKGMNYIIDGRKEGPVSKAFYLYLQDYQGMELTVWRAETGKKPPSHRQTIRVPAFEAS